MCGAMRVRKRLRGEGGEGRKKGERENISGGVEREYNNEIESESRSE